jgi:putative acetyltransferase
MATAPPIVVRRATTRDAAAFARLMGDPGVYPGLMQLPFTSDEIWQQKLADNLAPGKADVVFAAELQGEVVGSAGLHPVSPSPRRRHAMMLGISVLPTAQGQGVGSALMQAMCDYADGWAQVLRLELQVYADNAPALALYRKFGFVLEGRHPAYAMRHGAYVESLSMARLHPNPPALPTRA